MVVVVQCRDDCRILQMLRMIELDGCGAFQNLDWGKRVAMEWGRAKSKLDQRGNQSSFVQHLDRSVLEILID